MTASLVDLGRQLLSAADPALLDTPLDALGGEVQDEEVRSLLVLAHEAGEADSMRDLLQEEQLAAWVERACTEREATALAEQLRSWLGLGGAAGDDPARLVTLEPLPDDPEALVDWARRHGVVGELMRPASEVLADAAQHAPEASLLEACFGDFEAGPASVLSGQQVQRQARAYLRAEAASALSTRARESLWQRSPPASAGANLRRLSERLRALLDTTTPAALHSLRFVPARPVALDVEHGRVVGALRADESGGTLSVSLLLSGYEQRAIEGSCSACHKPRCVHVRALSGRMLDACLDTDDRLHAKLRELVSVPSWRRFVSALGVVPNAVAASGDDASVREQAPTQRLSFAIRLGGESALRRKPTSGSDADAAPIEAAARVSVQVGAFVQRRRGDGRWSVGKLGSPSRLLRSGDFDDGQCAVLEAMAERARSLGPQFVSADLALLRSLVECPSLRLEADDQPLRVQEQQLHIEVQEQPDGLLPRVTLAGARVPPGERARDTFVVHHDAARGSLVFAALHPALRRLLAALSHFHGVLPPESYDMLAPWLASLRQVAQVDTPKVLDGFEHPTPDRLLLRISPDFDEGVELSLCMRAFPLSALWPPGQGPDKVHGLVDGKRVWKRRKLDWERSAAAEVIDALQLQEQLAQGVYSYRVASHAEALEVLSRAARLEQLLEIEWAERTRTIQVTQSVSRGDLRIRLFKRGHWLRLEGAAGPAGHRVAITQLLQAARRGERFVRIEGANYAEIEQSLFEHLQQAQLCVHEQNEELSVALASAPYFMQLLGEQSEAADAESSAWLARLRQADSEPEAEGAALDPELDAQLRGYQRQGARFLLQLSSWAPGACLADEMGLGKTIQTIAVLQQRARLGGALVVTPTSLVSNWLLELQRFAPGLRAAAYRGTERKRLLSELGPGVVLVTSYELLLRDIDHFADHHFATQVIDEAQVIKNARTRRARATAKVEAEFRIALSGTPVENRLADLWSLFQLIAPGLLGSWPRFRALFAVPIERYEDSARSQALRSLVAPFILRRTKDDVAADLPSRTEVVHLVELSPPEQELYDAAADQARLAFGKRKRHPDAVNDQLQILAELTRLRQLACHPRLLVQDSRVESSKLHSLLQLLDDILPRGHRALIFSQFTRHLALIGEALDARGLTWLYLDGSTPGAMRAQLVERFQAGEAPLFLISLKAGGTGLNLTAADYVVHMDPWWNPAAQDQASDRVHRIGQTRPVSIVKLVTQNTIEEKVLGLHEHKRRLADSVLVGGSAALDREALEALLAE